MLKNVNVIKILVNNKISLNIIIFTIFKIIMLILILINMIYIYDNTLFFY